MNTISDFTTVDQSNILIVLPFGMVRYLNPRVSFS